MSRYTPQPVAPPQPDGLSRQFLIVPHDQTDRTNILIVGFTGEYPDGSLGNAHGHFIACETMYGVHAFHPACVVLDFRRLTYRWGNTLLRVFADISQFQDEGDDAGVPTFPVVVVTSMLCRDGFLSLVTPSGRPAPEWVFEDMDSAIAHAVQASKTWLSA